MGNIIFFSVFDRKMKQIEYKQISILLYLWLYKKQRKKGESMCLLQYRIYFVLTRFKHSFKQTAIVDSFTKHTWVTLRTLLQVTFNRIAHYSRHILSFTYSIPPSLPVSILLLTFGWQPQRSPLSLHISAQQHSHGLCFARTHRSSPLNLLLPSESWLMPGPSSPSCWININIHHLALRLSQPHNDQLLNNASFMWVIGRNELAVVHLFVGHIYLQYGGLKLFFSQPLLLYIT